MVTMEIPSQKKQGGATGGTALVRVPVLAKVLT